MIIMHDGVEIFCLPDDAFAALETDVPSKTLTSVREAGKYVNRQIAFITRKDQFPNGFTSSLKTMKTKQGVLRVLDAK